MSAVTLTSLACAGSGLQLHVPSVCFSLAAAKDGALLSAAPSSAAGEPCLDRRVCVVRHCTDCHPSLSSRLGACTAEEEVKIMLQVRVNKGWSILFNTFCCHSCLSIDEVINLEKAFTLTVSINISKVLFGTVWH